MDGGSRDPETGRSTAGKPAGTAPSGRGAALSGGEFAGIGLQFAMVILVFAFAGVWLDKRFGSSPWLTIVFVFAGAGGGFYSMYRKVTAAQRRDADRRAGERK